MLCPTCSKDIPETTTICPFCKTAISQPGTPEPQSSKNSALKLVFIIILTLVFIVILATFSFQKVQIIQLRSKVSRVKAQMQTIATALESYYIDACVYPSPGRPSFREPGSYQGNGSFAEDGGLVPLTITTPVAYMTQQFHDPFRLNGKGYYGFGGGPGVSSGAGVATVDDAQHNHSGIWPPSGWIISSYGPDKVDGNLSAPDGKPLQEELAWSDNYSIDSPDLMQCDSTHPLVTSGFTYDPTNGTTSPGDV